MGANMARRLKDRGYVIKVVYDVRIAAATALARELGAETAGSLARVTHQAEVILTVISDDRAMRQIFATTGDSLLIGARGRLFINCATLTPQIHLEVEKRARKLGAETLEACMASSINQAREGTLYLMCGGRPESFVRARPLLESLSHSLRYIGKTGEAAKVKD